MIAAAFANSQATTRIFCLNGTYTSAFSWQKSVLVLLHSQEADGQKKGISVYSLKMTAISAAVLASTWVSGPAAASVKILGVNVSKNDICPNADTNKCLSKPNDATGYYLVQGRDLTVDANGKPNIDPILAKIFTETVRLDTNYCGNEVNNNLRAYSIANNIPYLEEVHSNPVHFTVKATKLLEAKGGIDAKAIATAAGVPAAQLDKVAAAVEASYNSSKTKAVDVTGVYRYIRINTDLTRRLEADAVPADLKSCAAWLKANPDKSIVTSITGYQLTKASISSSMKSTFAQKLTASVAATVDGPQIAAIEQSFSSAVEKTSELSFSPYFQVLTVGRYPG
ncbi:hypothetical protein C7W88_22095 (plasmid) [Novosphingobium sp. THN1]|nr:hypothetical protein C7W88_22095 [Novosphingobium sp. THN1]